MPSPRDRSDPRAWCVVAVARLARDQPEGALEAAGEAVERDPGGEWGHRLMSLALERLGRDSEAAVAAQDAVRLAPGSWAARLRYGSALRRAPGRWRDAWAQAQQAVRFAPEQPDPHVLIGDLALARGDFRQAATAYRTALRRDEDHPSARINLGLTHLRWERPRDHHDPTWTVDPRETGRARRALEVWSRQVRVLAAFALTAVAVLAFWYDLRDEARIGGAAVLALILAATVRQARRITVWRYVPGMLARDLWLSVSVSVALLVVAAYVAALATLPDWSPGSLVVPLISPPGAATVVVEWEDILGGFWAGLFGLVLFNGVAVTCLRVFAETWQGRPVRALAEFTAVPPERVGLRDTGVTLWIVAARLWSLVALLAVGPLVAGERRAALAAVCVPLALLYVRWRGGLRYRLRPVLRHDWPLAVVLVTLLPASAALFTAGIVAALGAPPETGARAWWMVAATLLVAVLCFLARAARAWWRRSAGPWRASLILCEGCGPRLPGDVVPPVGLSEDVRRAFTYSRGVVLSYSDVDGPRTLAVGAVTSISSSGELRLIATEEAWSAAARDPRVAVFVADPVERRFWAEVRGVALADSAQDVLRVTPKHVYVAEFPGRHEARTSPRRR
ncbi:CHAT domain-containing protein [Sphaerisporangium aureirubrum]|uniref:Tetratricopeptide repeat protein n=1 Tax=Sphaerisporangium aureirubrum TaxID=1544736 RepID=A0ABW1NAC4_9ACTN